MILKRLLALALILFGLLPLARGHEVSSVEFEFQGLENEWRLTGQMDVAYMLPETRDLPGSTPLSRQSIMKAPPEELARIRMETEKLLRRILVVRFNDKVLPWTIDFPDFKKVPFELPQESGDWALITTKIVIPPQPGPGELRAYWDAAEKSELIVTIEIGDDFQILSASGGSNMLLMQVAAPPAGQAEAPPVAVPAKRPFAGGFIATGFDHVLGVGHAPGLGGYIPLGLDHILFILGLFLLLPSWKPLAWQSLLFTLAHSITLSLAVFEVVSLPPRWIDLIIAVTIAWVGIENLFVKKVGKQRYIVVFCFGLLHGIGYATGFKAKLAGVANQHLIIPILGFNIGVELAQLTILAVALLLFLPLAKWKKEVRIYGSITVAVIGCLWIYQRLLMLSA